MRKKIQIFFKLIISALVLVYIFNKIPLGEIGSSLYKANINLLFTSLIFYIIVIYLLSYPTSFLTRVQKIKITANQIFKINLITKFYGLFLPGSISGNLIRWYKLSRYGNKTDSAAVVLFNRFLETFILIYTGIVFFISYLIIKEEYSYILIAVIVLIGLILSYILLLYPPSLNFIEKIINSFSFPAAIKNFTTKFFEAMHRFHKLKIRENVKILSMIFIYHIISISVYFMLAKSLSLNIGFIDIAWIRTATILLSMIPVSFAGLGVREGTLIYILSYYGISANDALTFSFLIFFLYVLVSIGGGVTEFINFLSTRKDLTTAELQVVGETKPASLNSAEHL